MTISAVHFSSEKDDWATPPELFARWNRIFQFDLDAAATAANALTTRWLGEHDGLGSALRVRWADYGTRIWVNPPYGRGIGAFTAKAAEAAEDGALVCGLLPARTDTAWWQDTVLAAGATVHFLRGRVTFEGAPASAPFPSAIAVWWPKGVLSA